MEFKPSIDLKFSGVCELSKAPPAGVVIFGASGDLASKRLLPSFANLVKIGSVPDNFFILGAGRTAMDEAQFRAKVRQSLINAGEKSESLINNFSSRCYYERVDYSQEIGRAHV